MNTKPSKCFLTFLVMVTLVLACNSITQSGTETLPATSEATDQLLVPSPYSGPVPPGAYARIGKGVTYAMDISSDGQYLALATSIGSYLYSAETFTQLWYDPYESSNIAFAPNDQKLVTINNNRYDDKTEAILWDMNTGKQLLRVEILDYDVHDDGTKIAITPDNNTLIIGGTTFMIIIDLRTGTIRIPGNNPDVYEFGPGVEIANIGNNCNDDYAEICSLFLQGIPGVEIEDMRDIGVATSPTENILAFVSNNYFPYIFLVDMTENRLIKALTAPTLWLTDGSFVFLGSTIQFSSDGLSLMGVDEFGRVYKWDIVTGNLIHTFETFAFGYAFSPDGEVFVSVHEDSPREINLWHISTGEKFLTIQSDIDLDYYINAMAFFPDSLHFLIPSLTGIAQYDLTGRQLRILEGHGGIRGDSLSFSPDGTYIIAGEYSGMSVWDTTTLQLVSSLASETLWYGYEPFEDNYFPVQISDDNSVYLWYFVDGNLERIFSLDDSQDISHVRLSPNGKILTYVNSDSTELWDVEAHTLLHVWQDVHSPYPIFSPDGGNLALCDYNEEKAMLWNMITKTSIVVEENGCSFNLLAFSLDGRTLASTGTDKEIVTIWNVATGVAIQTLTVFTQMEEIALSPDGQMLAIAGNYQNYNKISIWSVKTGELLIELAELNDSTLRFSPDGRLLATVSGSSIVLWNIEEYIEAVEVTNCTNKVSYVADVSIPDNTVLAPGQEFVKTWRLRNDGDCTWTTAYALEFVEGDAMGFTGSQPLTVPASPGQEAEISVTLTSPSVPGTYRSDWQLSDERGNFFGLGANADVFFYVQIVVQ